MTQHTDMGGLTRREQIARIIEPGAAWDAYPLHVSDLAATALAKADAIEALSIPQGLGEDE